MCFLQHCDTYLMLWIRRIVAVGLLHDVLSPAQSFLPLPFGRVVRLPNSLFVTKAAAAVRLRVGVATGFSGILINEIFLLFKLFAILSLTNLLNSHLVTANLPKIASKNLKSFKKKKNSDFFSENEFTPFFLYRASYVPCLSASLDAKVRRSTWDRCRTSNRLYRPL
jgi:hypothetical protein